MMELLPSYHEATTRPDWLPLVAPYVSSRDYPALCLVSKRFWQVFAPRLWHNVLRAIRRAGLQSGDDLAWWFSFVFTHLYRTESRTRALTGVLDAREFGKDGYHFASDQPEKTLNQSFQRALTLFPKLTCLLLDGHSQLDPNDIFGASSSSIEHRLLLLSIANLNCPAPLPTTFFNYPSLHALVYLDVSGIPGSVWSMALPGMLPDLRILKVRHREVDDATFCALVLHFRKRLWSLDVSDNKLSDDAIEAMVDHCFRATKLRSNAFFRVEGDLTTAQGGSQGYGSFMFVEESDRSGSFSHPERYLVDAPAYTATPDSVPQEYQSFRSDGRARVKPDSADAMLRACSGADSLILLGDYCECSGLTHLRVSNNQISSFGIERLLRESNGHLEVLACDSMPLIVPTKAQSQLWPKSAKLYGILNVSQFLRPVFSSNLRVLRLHHSFVTQIPTLETEGLSTMSRLYIAETSILSRSKKAYPQFFVPDMNPRLTSLTLTHIPRRSSGPLIASLIQFLRLLSAQERTIFETKMTSFSLRGPDVLDGLRHLRLEFDPDPREEGFSMSEDLDAEELMNAGEGGFSFFDQGSQRRQSSSSKVSGGGQERGLGEGTAGDRSCQSDRADGEFLTHHGEWNGETFSVAAWIGPETPSRNSALDKYRRLVLEHNVRDRVGPATASQVIAGAPSKSYIFQTAWCMAVMPDALDAPSFSELTSMKDVLEELKRFRLAGRAKYESLKTQQPREGKVAPGEPHYFWTGKLEVSRETPLPRSRPLQYWR